MATTTKTPHPRSSLRRTACDRCRHSKLKCFRDENQQKCARCLRLELRCEVAPAKPPGRPRKVISTHVTADGSSDHAEVLSPQLTERSHSPPEIRNSEPPSQGLEDLQPIPDEQPRVNTIFGQRPMPSVININGFHINAVMPHSEFRAPEWYEATVSDSGFVPSRDPLEVHSLFTVRLDRHECFKELSQLNVDLHVHRQALGELIDTDRIRFSTFTDHLPPPNGDGVSLAEKLLIISQRFQQAITNLCWVFNNDPKPLHATAVAVVDDDMVLDPLLNMTGPFPMSPDQEIRSEQGISGGNAIEQDGLLETSFVCLLVSCYVQMISLWEIMFVHVHRRINGVDMDQLTLSDPGKGVQMGAFYIFSGRLQSMFYCQAVLYFLDNIDRGLCILPEQREQGITGLLSHPQHFHLLQRELGGQFSKWQNERVRALRYSVEEGRLSAQQDIGW